MFLYVCVCAVLRLIKVLHMQAIGHCREYKLYQRRVCMCMHVCARSVQKVCKKCARRRGDGTLQMLSTRRDTTSSESPFVSPNLQCVLLLEVLPQELYAATQAQGLRHCRSFFPLAQHCETGHADRSFKVRWLGYIPHSFVGYGPCAAGLDVALPVPKPLCAEPGRTGMCVHMCMCVCACACARSCTHVCPPVS